MTAATHAARMTSTLGGKYRIVRCIGEGGMGSVYEALHVVINRRFAVKFLRTDLAQRRDALARFQREASVVGAVENENIAQTVDFGVADDGAPYIVMEYLNGCDLARLLRRSGPLPVKRATDLAIQACFGIHAAHSAGVIHRDLKPANLFICSRSDQTDLLKIVDFGIAKLQSGEAGQAVTRTGAVFGTPMYMSPEQAKGSNVLDERADVYALGVILYEMISGRTPHPGDLHNAVIYHISTQPPVPLIRDWGHLPKGLTEVIMRALSTDAAKRQTSAAELAQQLAPFAHRMPWPAYDGEDGKRTTTGESVTAISPQLVEPRARTVSASATASAPVLSKARVPRLGIMVVGFALLSALLVGMLHSRKVTNPSVLRTLSTTGLAISATTEKAEATRSAIASQAESRSPVSSVTVVPEPSALRIAREATSANAARELVATSRKLHPANSGGSRGAYSAQSDSSTAAQTNPAGSALRASFDAKNPYE